jgi:hypothetical protein
MFSSHLQLNPQFWNLSTIIYFKSRSHEVTHGHTMSSVEHIVIDIYISPLNGNPMSNLHIFFTIGSLMLNLCQLDLGPKIGHLMSLKVTKWHVLDKLQSIQIWPLKGKQRSNRDTFFTIGLSMLKHDGNYCNPFRKYWKRSRFDI